MISYLKGIVLKTEKDGVILNVNDVGYQILLPIIVLEKIMAKKLEKPISLYIYFYQTERQPKPVLIGFNSEDEKEFFQLFISVDAIGPLKAVKAMEKPVAEITMAIESKDISFLSTLKGIGKRTAQKIVASLHGKTDGFSRLNKNILREQYKQANPSTKTIATKVIKVLVEKLGHNLTSAKKMVDEALERNISISTPEQLFDEVYQKGGN
ncbi:MAG: Holliday junction DNA helicase RuvA [Desulfobacteraceae bacterium 4572_130]|nr:MAG: Holliday junction DNA helicase RuvA [Desulfobacteraceae bacterium 4572_130]